MVSMQDPHDPSNLKGLQLAHRVGQIAPFHVMELAKRAAALEAQGRDIIHMEIGEPDFGAPPAVLDAAAAAMRQGQLQYTAATGLPELRRAISGHYHDTFGLDVAAERIIVTAGASGALLLACAALVESGAGVLMPDPCYPCNRHFVAAFDGKPHIVACGPEQRFQLRAEDVEAHWSANTQGVLLASPSNPTGTSVPPHELARIVAAVRARNGFVVIDEIYQGLSYDAPPFSALSLGEDCIVINSFSKYFSMTGWRLGWLVVPESLVPAIEKLAQNFFICPSSLAQHAALACFTPASQVIYTQQKEAFRQRRDFLLSALPSLGFTVPVVPDGAFYIYADCSALTDDAHAFALELLEQTGVALVPGLDFGPATARTHLRLSYANSLENLQEAMSRLRTYLSQR